MRKLEINELSNIQGGDVGDVINGACAALAAGSYLTIIALSISTPVGAVIGGACLVNVIGNGAGWW
ncbi:MAG: hypothetical protein JKY08_11130 [Flavobacteriaceae bacterium]|nr:hypothetical protein [Flavobacteriaceae bacterium]